MHPVPVKTTSRLQATAVDCGAICLGIILDEFGFIHSALELRRLCEVGRDGATVSQIQKGAEKLGHECTIYKKGLKSLAKTDRPIILYWDLRHFVVFEGMTDECVWINDPAVGRRRLTIGEFEKHYTGICLAITPKENRPEQTRIHAWKGLLQLASDRTFSMPHLFAIGTMTSGVIFALELLFGGGMRIFFDFVVELEMSWWGYVIAAISLPTILARFLLRVLQSIWYESRASNVKLDMKTIFLKRILVRPPKFDDMQMAGEFLSRISDLDRSVGFIMSAIHSVGRQVTIVVFALVMLLLFAPLIALVSTLPKVLILISLILQNRVTQELEINKDNQEMQYQAIYSQHANGLLRFYACGQQRQLFITCFPFLARMQAARADHTRSRSSLRSLQQTVEMTSVPISLFAGAYLMITGQLTYGGFMLASMLAIILSTHIGELTENIYQFSMLKPVAGRVVEIYLENSNEEQQKASTDTLVEDQNPMHPIDSSPAVIEVKGLGFKHPSSDQNLFNNINLAINAGEVVGLTGPSGVGKTTLLDLMSGLREPTTGLVLFKGKPLEGFAQVGYVFSDDDYIFGSLTDFVSSGNIVDLARLKILMNVVELQDRLGFFMESPGDERLEDEGLSRGEMQRLQLAKALYRSEDCIFFDEAFSHLSFSQSSRIIRNIQQLGTSLVLATHRAEILGLCDNVVQLDL
mgnify:CR=1 FL=1